MTKRVLVIMGSVRAGRLCPAITQWVSTVGQDKTNLAIEIIDLAEWPLPMDDEPGLPALGLYKQPHSKAWSEKVAQADGFVFVTPQYNWGYPAVLKNAIDHCYLEWKGKPLMIVTYGGHGGGKCAAQLCQVADGLKMRPVFPMPAITLSNAMIREHAPLDEVTFEAALSSVQDGWTALAESLSSST
ncbi:NADPH-dependent FMN reductase [Kozakia baliensis]|uniref:NADPH-dependent FMN reductase n=1 Tax=Kozakia baliensis TaxID=153496 RepID=UPI00087960AB|nr:NADPH-dependent FMN reductase [Kozakia baliensis]AOX20088.1 NAD(FAD)-dependent dehydrogenase [Kozakia baliensis]